MSYNGQYAFIKRKNSAILAPNDIRMMFKYLTKKDTEQYFLKYISNNQLYNLIKNQKYIILPFLECLIENKLNDLNNTPFKHHSDIFYFDKKDMSFKYIDYIDFIEFIKKVKIGLDVKYYHTCDNINKSVYITNDKKPVYPIFIMTYDNKVKDNINSFDIGGSYIINKALFGITYFLTNKKIRNNITYKLKSVKTF